MKNIYVLPTSQPSRLFNCFGKLDIGEYITTREDLQVTNQHIYITSAEEIKDSWVLNTHTNEVYFLKGYYGIQPITKKVILTTDQDLIADGVQAIDDDFLEWFVNNPSCENVEVEEDTKYFNIDELRERSIKGLPRIYSEKIGYKIIIPKEEPSTKLHKGEVVDESYPKEFDENKKNLYYYKQAMNPYSAEEYSHTAYEKGFIEGYQKSTKWQQEQDNIANEILEYILLNDDGVGIALGYNSKEMIENYFKRINYEK